MKSYKPTVSQRLIWMDQVLSETSSKYNIGGYAVLEGDLDHDRFNRAIGQVLAAQEVYASVFSESGGELTVSLREIPAGYAPAVLDFAGQPDAEAKAVGWMKNDFARAFDPRENHLFCFRLLRTAPGKHFWYAKIHHLISDGWSFRLLLNQAAECYQALGDGQAPALPVYRYSEYAADEEAYYQSPQAAADRAFWLAEYENLPEDLFPRTARGNAGESTAGTETLHLSAEAKNRLKAVAEANGVSLFQLIVGLLLIYFGRVQQQNQIAVGVPVLNRGKRVYRNTAGIFMNLLSCRFAVNPHDTLADVLTEVKKKMSGNLRHQRYQYGNLINDLNLQQQDKLLHHIRVSYEDFEFTSQFGSLRTGAQAFSNLDEVDPLAIYVRDYHNEGFDVRFIYNCYYLGQDRVESICRGFLALANGLPADAGVRVQDLDIMSPAERETVLAVSAGPARTDDAVTFPALWEQAVARHREAIAVSAPDGRFAYGQVEEGARKVARALRQDHIGRGDTVAVLLPPSGGLVTGIIGVMKTGGCYVPLDHEYP
ncbi:MAG TPA: condensation domain-containing protein, partial [Cytophagales bacterium]